MMCLAQRHIKRLLAFSTISHMGMLLIAAGLMSPEALSGAATYTLGHGLVKGALFLLAGILLHCRRTVDELELRGRGRGMPVLGAAFLVAALGIAGLPPFATGAGKALIEHAARESGRDWVAIPLVLGACMTGGAVLRVVGCVFLGWGVPEQGGDAGIRGDESRETWPADDRAPAVMVVPVVVLLVGAAASGFLARDRSLLAYAERVVDSRGYQALVLDGASDSMPSEGAIPLPAPGGRFATLVTIAASFAIALTALFGHRLPAPCRWAARTLRGWIVDPVRAVHSGKVGDYVTWLTLGVAAFAAALGLLW
jgi:multicomponent Na+:H+ antiporter subunit D